MLQIKIYIIQLLAALKKIFATWRIAILAAYLLLLGFVCWRFADTHLFENLSIKKVFNHNFLMSAGLHTLCVLIAIIVLIELLKILGRAKFKKRFHQEFVEHEIKTSAGKFPTLLVNTKDANGAMNLIFYTHGLPLFSNAEQIDNIGRILDISIKGKPKNVYGSNQLFALKAVDGFAEANRGDIIE